MTDDEPVTKTVPSTGTNAVERPSLAAQAAKGTTRLTKGLVVAIGLLSVAGQIIAIWKPEYAGPIIEALRLLASLGGGEG